jgi:ATP-dependent Zn protease
MVTKLGMSEEIGYIGYKDKDYQHLHSELTHEIIDKEIGLIIK